MARESSNKYFLAIEAPSMALDPCFHTGMTGSLNLGLISKSERKDTRFMLLSVRSDNLARKMQFRPTMKR